MVMDNELIDFGMERRTPSIIMVAGVGGAGGNAVNHMHRLGIKDVTFMICNTDKDALNQGDVELKIQLGDGLGAGNDPEKARAAAEESADLIAETLRSEGTKMLFITAGLGGGTGTGASPILARIAKSMGILTVAVVTTPLRSEGRKRARNAQAGLDLLKENIDSLLLIRNDNIYKMYGNLPNDELFHKADDILASSAKSIAEIITVGNGVVNVDFADVNTVMRESGRALLGTARATGENRAMEAAEQCLTSPLLDSNDIRGAKNIFLYVSYDKKKLLGDESLAILDYIQNKAQSDNEDEDANIIWGFGPKEGLGDDIEVTIVVTGFDNQGTDEAPEIKRPEPKPVKTEEKPEVQPNDKAKAEPAKQPAEQEKTEKTNPFHGIKRRPTAPVNIIKVERKKRYDNIDEVTKTPAYLAHKDKFVDTTHGSRIPAGSKSAKGEAPQTTPGGLFDDEKSEE